jgi:protein gp37
MGENSAIEWTDHTFNPWIGCQEMSAACDNCYARVLNERWHYVDGWGPHGERRRTSDANWKKPMSWAKTASVAGSRPRVFCASLADVFDNKAPAGAREDLWDLIRRTPELDWLLLTKRPENIKKMLPADWSGGWGNVWLGTTAEDQEHYVRRYKHLSAIPAAVRFISYEPALNWLRIDWVPSPRVNKPDWLICGGESGSRPREMNPAWARMARDHCAQFGIAFFMKQMTGKAEIPDDLLIRQFPTSRAPTAAASTVSEACLPRGSGSHPIVRGGTGS